MLFTPERLTRRIRWTIQEVAVQLFDESIAVIDRFVDGSIGVVR